MQKMNGKNIVGPDPLYFLEFGRRRLEHAGKGAEVIEEGAGLFLAVFTGSAEDKQEFEHLRVGKSLYALPVKFIL
jgi:hypothetical protein